MPRVLLHPLPADISEQVYERLRRMLVQFEELRQFAEAPGTWHPPIDLCETGEELVIRAELPGIKRDQVRITIEDNILKIEGHKERLMTGESEADKPQRYLCLERAYGSFARTIALRWPVQVDRITARLADGVLTLHLPKAVYCGREVTIPIDE